MKIFSAIARLIVGSLFIVSGLIKCNDPIGFSYKLNDYFAYDVLNMEFLIPYSLLLAVMICVVEIVLGVAVIFGLKSKLSTTLILLMMLFFTWLTWYTSSCLEAQEIAGKLGEAFDKNCVTDCGCFGDALKLEPKESFYKDLFLLLFTIPLFIFGIKGKIPPNKPKQDIFYIGASLILILGFGVFVIGWWFTLLFSIVLFAVVYLIKNKTKGEWLSLLAAYVLSLGFTWYCLQNLPIKDFRPYKIGASIQEGMAIPEDAPKPVIEYRWKFNVDGKEEIITTDGSYPSVEGDYVSVETEVVEAGYDPPIKDFSIESSDEDFTEQFLSEENLIVVVMYNIDKTEKEGLLALKSVTDQALKNGYKVIGLSATGEDTKRELNETYKLNFETYLCDEKVLKTIIRSNPGILEMNKGTIKQKLHWNNFEDLQLETLPNAKPNFNFELKKELDDIYALDQGVREIYFAKTKEEKDAIAKKLNLPIQEDASGYMKVWNDIDSINVIKVEKIIEQHGYPGKDIVGEPTNEAAWYVIQHSDKIPEYLPLMKEKVESGDLPFRLVAMMEDRYLMSKNEEQIYGTQGSSYFQGTDKEVSFIWPIKDAENVNERRKEAGYTSTIEDYAKQLFGEDFEYKVYTIEALNNLGLNRN